MSISREKECHFSYNLMGKTDQQAKRSENDERSKG